MSYDVHMYKLQTFWHVFRHSLIPFDYYYHKVRSTRYGFSFSYFVSLTALVVFLTISAQTAAFVTVYPKERIASLISSLKLQYPDDLVITLLPQGRLVTNDDMPFTLFSPIASNPRPLVVVDPKATREEFYSYDAPVVFAENSVFVQGFRSVRSYQYNPDYQTQFTVQDAHRLVDMTSRYLDWYPWIVSGLYFVLLVVGWLTLLSSHLVLAFIMSLGIMITLQLLTRIEKPVQPIHFGRLKQIALHTMTAPLLLGVIFIVSPLTPTIPHWYLVAHILFQLAGVYEAYYAKKERIIA